MPAENRMFSSMLHAARERLIAQSPTEIARKSGASFADGEFSLRMSDHRGRGDRRQSDSRRAHRRRGMDKVNSDFPNKSPA